jgi:hypothetical protein
MLKPIRMVLGQVVRPTRINAELSRTWFNGPRQKALMTEARERLLRQDARKTIDIWRFSGGCRQDE